MNTLIKFIFVGVVGLLAACNSSSKAPDVSFHTLDGDDITLQSLKGNVVFLKFWATDCTTCVAQMPDTAQYHTDYADKGLSVIAVAMKHDPVNYVRNFTESRQLPFTVALDSDGSVAKAFDDVRLTPTAFLIDRQGHIVRRYVGNYDKQTFINTLEKALAG
ncbi:TlpA family protein disulfide reductase [Paenalcaligenes niemegkensis]|uniref:peroxiredoxin family protein n=1 Tax=Paenalcaligenes niemegkensis TaxID=2895469 RepID=UPI001EE902E6|nr:TlpA disulfide reductase family protein [Paenalcaligenes niemegkensis]MCQ9615575.1 TlpA family protein disulfide reductase [Paenalcaligenes niemegkensis]